MDYFERCAVVAKGGGDYTKTTAPDYTPDEKTCACGQVIPWAESKCDECRRIEDAIENYTCPNCGEDFEECDCEEGENE